MSVLASLSCSDNELFENSFYWKVTGLIDTEFGCYFLGIFEVNGHLKIMFDTYGDILHSYLSKAYERK